MQASLTRYRMVKRETNSAWEVSRSAGMDLQAWKSATKGRWLWPEPPFLSKLRCSLVTLTCQCYLPEVKICHVFWRDFQEASSPTTLLLIHRDSNNTVQRETLSVLGVTTGLQGPRWRAWKTIVYSLGLSVKGKGQVGEYAPCKSPQVNIGYVEYEGHVLLWPQKPISETRIDKNGVATSSPTDFLI